MGHGNHWEAIGGEAEKVVAHWIPLVVSGGSLTASTKFEFDDGENPPREEEAVGIVWPESPLRFLAIVATDSTQIPPTRFVFSCYPFLFDGVPQRIEITQVEDWVNPLEGFVHGDTEGGASVCFFDALYFLNKGKYKVGSSLEFNVAALAYQFQKCETHEFEITEGPMIEIERQRLLEEDPNADVSSVKSVSVSLENACWLMPTKIEDDFEFRGVPKEIQEVRVDGAEFLQVKMTLIRPDDIDFDVMVYVSRHSLRDYEPKIGEAVEGFVWLQGHLIQS